MTRLVPFWGKGALLAQFPGAYRFVARSGADLAAEDTADEVDLLGGPLRALVSLQAGDDGAHVGGCPAAGQRQVRLEPAPGVRRHRAGAAGRGADRGRELGQPAAVARDPGPQHVRPGGLGERAGPGQAEGDRAVPPRSSFQPGQQPGQAQVRDLAEEGEGDVPGGAVRPPQVVAQRAQRRARRVQVVQDSGRWRHADEQPHTLTP